ncbi:PhnD/SsuA/transferrin family substrate-binding protein [Planctomycetota bacterium]
MRAIKVVLLALTPIIVALGYSVASASGDSMVYYFDPRAGIKASDPFEKKFNGFMKKQGANLEIKVFRGLQELRAAIAKATPHFVIMPPYLRDELGKGVSLTPILIREHKRSSVYGLVVVGSGSLAGMKGQTLAASGDAASSVFLDKILFHETELSARDVRVLTVGKEIDAILAAGTGQAACACATKQSMELIKRANPAVAAKLSVLHKVEEIPFVTLYTWGPQDAKRIGEVKKTLGSLHRSRKGKKVLKLLKADKLVVPDSSLEEKIGS